MCVNKYYLNHHHAYRKVVVGYTGASFGTVDYKRTSSKTIERVVAFYKPNLTSKVTTLQCF